MKTSYASLFLGVAVAGTLSCGSNAAAVESTMTVARCQAVLDNGKQCTNQASEGKRFCWRHHGAAKAVGDGCTAAGQGAKSAWQATKTWSTNAFEKTRQGAEKAAKSTREAFKEAGDEFTKMMRETFQKDTQAEKGK